MRSCHSPAASSAGANNAATLRIPHLLDRIDYHIALPLRRIIVQVIQVIVPHQMLTIQADTRHIHVTTAMPRIRNRPFRIVLSCLAP